MTSAEATPEPAFGESSAPEDPEDELPPLPDGDVIMDDTDVESLYASDTMRKVIEALEAKLDAEERGGKRPHTGRRTRK